MLALRYSGPISLTNTKSIVLIMLVHVLTNLIQDQGFCAGTVVRNDARLSTHPNTITTRPITSLSTDTFVKELLDRTSARTVPTDKTFIPVDYLNLNTAPFALHSTNDTAAIVDILIGHDGAEGTMRTRVLGAENWTLERVDASLEIVHVEFGPRKLDSHEKSKRKQVPYAGGAVSTVATSTLCQASLHVGGMNPGKGLRPSNHWKPSNVPLPHGVIECGSKR